MKKIVLSALLIGLLTACSDDDKKSSQALNGKWQLLKYEFYTANNLAASGDYEEDNNSCPDYTEYKSNGNFQFINIDKDCEKVAESSGTYSFDGSNLKMTASGETKNYKVTSITATQFVLEDNYSENGVTYKDIAYFKKLN